MKTLKENESTKLGFFTGVLSLLVVGEGEVQLLKSLDGAKTYYNLTDASGELVEFSGSTPESVIFNSELENQSQQVHYALKCVNGAVEYMVQK